MIGLSLSSLLFFGFLSQDVLHRDDLSQASTQRQERRKRNAPDEVLPGGMGGNFLALFGGSQGVRFFFKCVFSLKARYMISYINITELGESELFFFYYFLCQLKVMSI